MIRKVTEEQSSLNTLASDDLSTEMYAHKGLQSRNEVINAHGIPNLITKTTSIGPENSYSVEADIGEFQNNIPINYSFECLTIFCLGKSAKYEGAHSSNHQPPPPPPPRHPSTFLSSLVPLTSCVLGQKDDTSYYSLVQADNRFSSGNLQYYEYQSNNIDVSMASNDSIAVTPDVIVGTPGQEHLNLKSLSEHKIKNQKNIKKIDSSANDSCDEEHNDYGFNQRPQVKSINHTNNCSNEILREMQEELTNSIQVG